MNQLWQLAQEWQTLPKPETPRSIASDGFIAMPKPLLMSGHRLSAACTKGSKNI
jgi:hypothetical protein